MKLNKGRVLIVVLWLAGLLIMGAAVLFWEARPQMAAFAIAILGMAVCIAGVIAYGVIFRCPDCGKQLPIGMWTGLCSCPYCGKDLKEKN